MKSVGFVGILLVVLGLLAFVVPVPHSENHGVKIGDAKIGVQTQTSEKLPPAAGIILLVGGVVALTWVGGRIGRSAPAGPGTFKGATAAEAAQWDLMIDLARDGDNLFRSRSRIGLK